MQLPEERVARAIGRRIRKARDKAELTQHDLAYRSGLGLSLVSSLERGVHVPRVDTLIKIAGGLGVTPCELLGDVRWTPPTSGPDGGFAGIE